MTEFGAPRVIAESAVAAVVETTARRAARVLLINADDRVLLFRGCDPDSPDHLFWVTVGGGLEPGESPVDGALRELFEETGLSLERDALSGPVRHEVVRFPFGGRWYDQEQEFYVARVASWVVDTSGFDAGERASIDSHHWWAAEELEATDERFYPAELPTLVRSAVTGGDLR